jgi:surfactin synthase thioesterase subunit
MSPTALVCLPFAGAGTAFFRQWSAGVDPAGLRIVPLQLPGRERRVDEDPYHDVSAAVDDLVAGLPGALAGTRRVALLGHSLGAVLAYELALRLSGTSGGGASDSGATDIEVVRLFVSGSPTPDVRRERRATGLPDEEFLNRVAEFAGLRHEAMADPEMRELILPVLRADIAMHENYVPGTGDPVPVPLVALRGSGDTLVTADEALGWAKFTTLDFAYSELPGGHMYLTESWVPLLRLVRRWVR